MEYRAHKCQLRKYRAFVDWTIGDERKRKYFTSHKTAKEWAADKNRELLRFGTGDILQDRLRVQAQEAEIMLEPYGKNIIDAVKCAIGHWKAALNSKTIDEAKELLVADRQRKMKAGQRGGSKKYIDEIELRLGRFAQDFGKRKLSEITHAEVQRWLDEVPDTIPERNSHRRVLSVLWTFSLHRGWCEKNVIANLAKEEEPIGEVAILTVEQAAKLLHHAPDRFKAHLAIGLFCGPRRSELERITSKSVNLQSGTIRIDMTKNRVRGAARRFARVRQNLRAWLLGYTISDDTTPQTMRNDLEEAKKKAGIDKWPRNGLRHSFCSYALEREKNLNDLTLEMGHTNPHTIFAHYRELVTPADAAAYWRLTPARAAALSSQ